MRMKNTTLIILFVAFSIQELLAITCPSSCPVLETLEGTSRCCSMGDATGCGLCETSSCPGNDLAKCSDISGANCDVEASGCSIQFGKAGKHWTRRIDLHTLNTLNEYTEYAE